MPNMMARIPCAIEDKQSVCIQIYCFDGFRLLELGIKSVVFLEVLDLKP
jgi:hypothetical protein